MSSENPYKINIELFEGPLDLLLHLIKKNDFEIADIPISVILIQYLDYIEAMKELNIDVAGEFILMAAHLTHIKSKLLVHDDSKEEDEDDFDPRADLVAKLREYQKYKNAAQWLRTQPWLARDVYKRPKAKSRPEEIEVEEAALEIEPMSLVKVFRDILKKAPKAAVHEVEFERVSVTERIYEIMDFLRKDDSMLFEDLFVGDRLREQVVVSFLAVLEMCRLKMIQVFQTDRFGPIRVRRVMELSEVEDIRIPDEYKNENYKEQEQEQETTE